MKALTIEDFFEYALALAKIVLTTEALGGAVVLRTALSKAMVDERNPKRPAFALRTGQARRVRARILAGAGLVIQDKPQMVPGETVAVWLERSMRGLKREKVLALLRAAAIDDTEPEELEARAG